MPRLRDSYTRYPRPILWLVRGGALGASTVASFYLGKRLVTNLQFEAFAPDFRRSPEADRDDDPAVGVTFDAARGYCAWYAKLSRKPMRLPTDVEWAYACRPAAPGRGAANAFGLLDTLGPWREWAQDDGGAGVLRGGTSHEDGRGRDGRHLPGRGARFHDAGFRVARSLK